ncbi:MAG: energy-coupling factor ABC transporter ATP-binding protein [Anaerolineae bacterium]
MDSQPTVEVRDLWYWYEEGHPPALQGINLTIGQGDFVGIVGQNGSGKTTLVKHFNGLLKPKRGRVLVEGRDTVGQTVGELAHHVGYVFQNPDHQIFCSTVRDEVAFGLRNLGLPEPEVEERTAEALALFGLTAHAETPPAVLGYGWRRAVTVASVWAMRPKILILDEPTTGLDWRGTRELMERVADLHQQGHTIVLITHDMKLVAEYAQRVLVMHQGLALAYGPKREVFREGAILEQAFLTVPPITLLARRMAACGMSGDALTVEEFYEEFTALRRLSRGRETRFFAETDRALSGKAWRIERTSLSIEPKNRVSETARKAKHGPEL